MITKAKLMDNVQFIYELALAQMELRAFNIEFNILNSLREFELLNLDSEKEKLLIKRLAYFRSINGEVTDYHRIQAQCY